MSYDVDLCDDDGGTESAGAWREWSPTYNLGDMLREGFGPEGILWLHGRQGREAVFMLQVVVAAMETDPDRFRRHNPANGWGDYPSCLEMLREMRDAAIDHPDAWFVAWGHGDRHQRQPPWVARRRALQSLSG